MGANERTSRRYPALPATLAAALAAACALPALAEAQPVSALQTTPTPRISVLAPGITHQRAVREGGQVVHIIRARRTPRVDLAPAPTGDGPASRNSLTGAIDRERDRLGIVAGINGDFFNFTTGDPSGVLLLDGALVKEPEPSRSALLVREGGLIDSAALSLVGRWQASDPSGLQRFRQRNFQGINRSAQRAAEAILYTPAYGRVSTPTGTAHHEVRIRLDQPRPLIPGVPVTGVIVDAGGGGGMTIGAGHAVLTGIGSSGLTMSRELRPGLRIELVPGLVSLPDMNQLGPDVRHAIGGGPLLVRDGRPVSGAGEGFTPAQVGSRTARTAIGQRADGTLLLVAAEGPVQGSRGITAAEHATIMAGLGARVAVAMDAGGSAQMALGTRRLVDWGTSPRSVPNMITLRFRGLLMDELPARISPNADRVDDAARVVVRTAEPGRVAVRIVHRRGRPMRSLWAGTLAGSSATVIVDPARLRLPDGVYDVISRLQSDGGETMQQSRRLIIDRTLGGLLARPSGRGERRRLAVAFSLQRAARVNVVVRNSAGNIVARLATNRPMRAGRNGVVWNRRIGSRSAEGRFRVEVVATGPLGRTGLAREVRLAAD